MAKTIVLNGKTYMEVREEKAPTKKPPVKKAPQKKAPPKKPPMKGGKSK